MFICRPVYFQIKYFYRISLGKVLFLKKSCLYFLWEPQVWIKRWQELSCTVDSPILVLRAAPPLKVAWLQFSFQAEGTSSHLLRLCSGVALKVLFGLQREQWAVCTASTFEAAVCRMSSHRGKNGSRRILLHCTMLHLQKCIWGLPDFYFESKVRSDTAVHCNSSSTLPDPVTQLRYIWLFLPVSHFNPPSRLNFYVLLSLQSISFCPKTLL